MGLDLRYFSKQSKKAVSEFKPRYHPGSVPFTVLRRKLGGGVELGRPPVGVLGVTRLNAPLWLQGVP